MKTLVLMVGLPRSGKTTLAKQMGFPIVSPDAIRLALHGNRFLRQSEPMVWTIAKYMVKALFWAGHDRVILDATNNTRKRRNEWKDPSWVREFKVVPTSEGDCIGRAWRDGRDDLAPIIERMAMEHEPVSKDELEEYERASE